MRNVMLQGTLLAACFGSAHGLEAGSTGDVVCALPLLRCAEEELRAQLAPSFEKVQLQVLRSPGADVSLRAGESMRARRVQWTGLPAKRMTVWMDIVSRAQVVRAIPVEIEVRAYVNGWEASADIRPGAATLNDASLKRGQVDVAALGAAPWREALDGYRLRKPLLAGQILTAAHMERLTAVTRGQLVDVKAGDGDLRIDVQARALQDGQVGDLIRVRLARSSAAVTGRVTAASAVEVVW